MPTPPANHGIFYAEIPYPEHDPFKDMSTDIEDDHEAIDYSQISGLSDEQVSQIAQDALEQSPAHQHSTSDAPVTQSANQTRLT